MIMRAGRRARSDRRPRFVVEPRSHVVRVLQPRAELRQHRRRVRDPRHASISTTSGDRRPSIAATMASSRLRARRCATSTRASSFNGSSAPPLTIRTGFDDNGDLVFNDRPAGVGRNSARTRVHLEFVGELQLRVHAREEAGHVGRRRADHGRARRTDGEPDRHADAAALSAEPECRHPEPAESGRSIPASAAIMTSPFFLQPTRADGVRRITFNTTVSF